MSSSKVAMKEAAIRGIRGLLGAKTMTSLGMRSLVDREVVEAHYLGNRRSTTTRGASAKAGKGASPSRPTHFLALPVNSYLPFHQLVDQVHGSILKHCPQLKETLVEPCAGHVTLCVLTLDSDDEISSLCKTLKDWFATTNTTKNLQLHLGNVRQFKSGVLYVEAEDASSQVFAMHSVLTKHLLEKGFLQEEQRSWTPHVTVAKFSKMRTRKSGKGRRNSKATLRKFPLESYDKYLDSQVGLVDVNCLQVCSMSGRRKGEYYQVVESFEIPS